MKIAVSNLAWDPDEDDLVAELLQSLRIRGLEIAPTRIWERPLDSTARDRVEYRQRWTEREFEIVSLQALLFGRQDLVIFESPTSRAATLDYLRGIIDLASDVGARRLVFGSPRNRLVGGKEPDEINAIALPFFRAVGDAAVDRGVVFCIEPNPAEYGCDWINSVEEGLQFVRQVSHPGIALNADSAGI
ncbi:MAG TPA: TIM barrel protein, partial [Gemmatimonadaceae bacterium]|nr:TIM barrel protein [Gemmatimonadaceae bacterium]